MEKNNLEKLENLMWKKYKKQISFQQLQKEFLKNDDERIEYIKTELEKAYNEKNGDSVYILISAIYMFKLYSEKFSNKKYSVQKYYDEIKLLSPNNICPYCLKREVRNLDHFLPKTEYPSLSISDANLIPSCSDCNHDKLNSTEIYINYYFEEIDDAPYMKCYADFNDGDINFRYELVKPSSWDDDKFNRLKNQFEQTKLLKFYAEQAKIEYSRKEKSFRRSIKDSSSYSERLKFEISDLIADEEETLGINSLEAALWRGLNEDGEKLFEHIRLLPIR